MIQNKATDGFIYSFDMSDEISHFKRLPDDIQCNAERHVVNVIYESFVVTGDQDYLMARMLAQNGLPRGFFWAASQALEKYLKAFLLMKGYGVTNFNGHLLKKLFEAANNIDSSLANLDIHPHKSIFIEPSVSHLFKKFTVIHFISEIEKYGKADNRYNASGVEYNTGHLCALDSLVFQLRAIIGVIPIDDSFKRLSPELITGFERSNPWFNKGDNYFKYEAPSKDFPIQFSVSVTSLDYIKNNEGVSDCMLAMQWLDSKMKLPK